MSEHEFDLIRRCFAARAWRGDARTLLAIGDDASLHRMESGMEWVISTDTSVQGVHWPEDLPLDQAADRAVAAALSDLAAMGAQPVNAWLNAVASDAESLDAMGRGASRSLERARVELAGGDTVHAGINLLAVTVAGLLPVASAMRRDRARPGDSLWLCGRVGFAAFGLANWQAGKREEEHVHAFVHVQPRIAEGIRLRRMGVRACIDISDGLVADAGHMARASGCTLEIELSSLPDWRRLHALAKDAAIDLAAAGGEDYALLISAPDTLKGVDEVACRIGWVRKGDGPPCVRLLLDGQPVRYSASGYDHFAD